MGTEKQETIKLRATPKTVWTTVVVVLVLWGLNLTLPQLWCDSSWDERGTFGDMFGAANALFSALALVGVIIAILMQREELEYQRNELEMTRGEIKGQKEQLKLQKEQMEIQNFENRFFQMVELWRAVRESLGQPSQGVAFIVYSVKPSIEEAFRLEKKGEDIPEQLRSMDCAVRSAYAGLGGEITNYMRLLYNLMKLIYRSGIDEEDQKFYSNIVRAQLSQAELVVIYYNCLAEWGRHKFKPIIEEYSLFKHLDPSDLVLGPPTAFYDPKAFARVDGVDGAH